MASISVRSCLFRLEFEQFSIQLKHSEFSLPGHERHSEELFPFYLSYDKPCVELALGENCIKFSRPVFGNTDRYILFTKENRLSF